MARETKADKEERERVAGILRERIAMGSTVYCVLKHVSRSGMQRSIATLIGEDGGVTDVSGLVARAVGMPFDQDRGAVKVGGSGMDMGFHLVYTLGSVLFPDGGPLELSPRAYQEREEGKERDGGYLLRHRWL